MHLRNDVDGQRLTDWLWDDSEAEYTAALERLAATGGQLTDAMQAAARQAVIQEFMSRDPYLRARLHSAGQDDELDPPGDGALISVTQRIGRAIVRHDLHERWPGALEQAGTLWHIVFSEDDAGRAAAAEVERLSQEGGSTRIEEGIGVQLPEIPLALRGHFPEEGLWGPMEVFAQDALVRNYDEALAVVLAAGAVRGGRELAREKRLRRFAGDRRRPGTPQQLESPMIRQPKREGTWEVVELNPLARDDAGAGPWRVSVLTPRWIRLFGEEHYAGMEWNQLEQAVLAEGSPPRLDPRRREPGPHAARAHAP